MERLKNLKLSNWLRLLKSNSLVLWRSIAASKLNACAMVLLSLLLWMSCVNIFYSKTLI